MFRKIVFFTVFLGLLPFMAFAGEYKVSLAQMPVYAESTDKGVLVDLVKAIEKESGNKISLKVMPFASSVYMAQKGKTDFHMPLIKNDILDEASLPFSYSNETIFHVNFVLYTKKGSDVTLDNLSSKNIETDRAHVNYFPFDIKPTNSIAKSLEKLHNGQIDGFIFADFATDPFLKEAGYKDIQRGLYKVFESKMVLPKNERGKQVDTMLTASIKNIRANGQLEKIMHQIDLPYSDWQP
jgi:polar amino acid transport system substrate-binding protein